MNFGKKMTAAVSAMLAGLMLLSGAAQAATTNINAELNKAKPGPMTKAKYVFLFIGDGMASVQIHAAEAYLANKVAHDEVGGTAKANLLGLSKLPVQGMMSTFPWNSLITDSAPAATAMATGMKTGDGVISKDPTKTVSYETLAEVAHKAGMKVGIVSSVSIEHATPACFYAHQPNRNSYYSIAKQLPASGFEYFGGGGFTDPTGTKETGSAQTSVYDIIANAGYAVADQRSEFDNLVPGTKAVAINKLLDSSKALYYDIDRSYDVQATPANEAEHITLAEFTQKGIDLLNNSNGFFMMVEGGKIDWACHANDARASIDDTVAFDDAVKVAIDFMKAHPTETLIVVTGDHETGGLTMGWAGTGYASNFEKLEAQKGSYGLFDTKISKFKTDNAGSLPMTIQGTTLADDMKNIMGLDYSTLTTFEKQRIDDAYTKAILGTSTKTAEEEYVLYGSGSYTTADGVKVSGSYNPLSMTITHIINNRAGIGWTSYSHTAVPVPVLADGASAEMFDGFYDNTDLAHKVAAAMRLQLHN